MPSQVDAAATAIASALAPSPEPKTAKWRWGTVSTVNNDGTMDVTVGSTAVAGINAATHVTGASVGDRVRVAFYGTDVLVDAVYATSAATVRSDMTKTSNVSSMNSAPVRRHGGIGMLTVAELKLSSALANGSSVHIGTIPSGYQPVGNVYAPVSIIANGSAYRNIYALIYYADAGTNAGRVYVYNRSGTSLAAGTPMSFTATYIVG